MLTATLLVKKFQPFDETEELLPRTQESVGDFILRHMSPVHFLAYYFSNIDFSTIHPSKPRSHKLYLPLRYSKCMHSSYPPYVICVRPSHPLWLDYPNGIWCREQILKCLITQLSSTTCYFLYVNLYVLSVKFHRPASVYGIRSYRMSLDVIRYIGNCENVGVLTKASQYKFWRFSVDQSWKFIQQGHISHLSSCLTYLRNSASIA
jgi:hypothetical protein